MLSDAQLAEIRSRINPAYRDWPGCDSHERNLLVGEIDRLRGERKVLADLLHQAGDVLETIDSECLYEALELGALVRQIAAAVTAVRTESNHQSTSKGPAHG